jgi:hypothetical protein
VIDKRPLVRVDIWSGVLIDIRTSVLIDGRPSVVGQALDLDFGVWKI